MSNEFKMSQQPKSSKIVSLFEIIIHECRVLLMKKTKTKKHRGTPEDSEEGREEKYIKHNSIYESVNMQK